MEMRVISCYLRFKTRAITSPGITDEELLSRNAAKMASKFCEKGLRYDLTVPFARYVVMHRDEITFPFKRYQIQPVWRARSPSEGTLP